MKNKALHDTAYYMSLPYTMSLKRDDEGDFVCRIEELQGCVAHGKDELEALGRLKKVQELWIQDCLEAGDSVPLPKDEEELPSGKWLQRVPRSLHKSLAAKASREGVSLNQLVSVMLARGLSEATMSPLIDECLVARFGQTQVGSVEGKHLDLLWARRGRWNTPNNFAIPRLAEKVAGIASMVAPETSTVLYNDDKKETADPWRATLR
jgi:predicted RNase H-like HicB family nuclease